jgi:hypothetical protein
MPALASQARITLEKSCLDHQRISPADRLNQRDDLLGIADNGELGAGNVRTLNRSDGAAVSEHDRIAAGECRTFRALRHAERV